MTELDGDGKTDGVEIGNDLVKVNLGVLVSVPGSGGKDLDAFVFGHCGSSRRMPFGGCDFFFS